MVSGFEARVSEEAADEISDEIGVKRNDRARKQEDLDALKRSGSALGASLVRFRETLAEGLGISAEDLPFLGEMWEVQEEEWKGAANRALGEVATHVLVPGHHFEQALGIMRSRKWGTKVDLRNADERTGNRWSAEHAARDALSTIIAVKDHPLAEAAEGILRKSADYALVSADTDLAGRRSITRDGAISFGGGHARKDDRHDISDRSKWVIGWSNASREAALVEEIEILDRDIAKREQTRKQHRDGAMVHRSRESAATSAKARFEPFERMDVNGAAAQITHITAQIEKIRSGSLAGAEEQLQNARAERKMANEDFLDVSKKVAAREATLTTAQNALATAHANARRLQAEVGPMPLRIARVLANIGLGKTGSVGATSADHPGAGRIRQAIYTDAARVTKPIRDYREWCIAQAERRIRDNADKAKQHIGSFFHTWPEEGGKTLTRKIDDIRTGAEAREAWRARLATIEYHDIKSLEKTIEQRDRNTIFAALPKVQGSEQDYAVEIAELETGINEVLGRTIYDQSKGSYARLEIKQKVNPVTAEFRRLLKDCLVDISDLSTEEVYRRARDFVEWIEVADPGTRAERLSKGLDMRQWYTIRLVEYRPVEVPGEDGTTEEVLNILSGSTTASGGEAERLSSFFMGAGVSHAFGSCDTYRERPPLQLFIVDEAFKHCTDDTAKGAMIFLERLGLQLTLASPIEKVSAFEGFADRFYVVSKEDNQSFAQAIAYEEIDADMAQTETGIGIGDEVRTPIAAE